MPSSLRRTTKAESHPRSVNMLDRSELKMLTQILHLDNTDLMKIAFRPQIERLIQNLPKRLRRPRPLSLSFKQLPSTFCDLHLPLNADLISHIFLFVQIEVTQHFILFEKFPELCHPVEEEILIRLRALRGMWIKPGQEPRIFIPNGWSYQIDGCRACMLARVASDMEAVRNLRVVILSRTRTRRKHRARTLMGFVNECINQFTGDQMQEIYTASSELAFGMKAARKACTRAEFQRRGYGNRRGSKTRHHGGPSEKEELDQSHQGILFPRMASLLQIPEHGAAPTPSASCDSQYSMAKEKEGTSPKNNNAENAKIGPDAVDELMEMYRNMGKKKPFSRDTLVRSAMVAPLNIGAKNDKTINELAQLNDQYDRLSLMPNRPPHRVPGPGATSNRSSRDVPVIYQPSPSDYSRTDYHVDSSSDWMDDDCTDSDGNETEDSNSGFQEKSETWTTWDLMVGHHNMI
ncbi:hypothetical protein N7509_011575 [Penicillium cosmopolitanum]|uniref:Uncharacterized protein n=1 Tax=Penicillium cosmopolitanum TaxID=1131564 RepID=A0A9W9SH01_9EURO|nr:uncharacterized protein N7509_011575 [Penicillium cosmopolitanum]KAJ5378456.1 hypothetical protein N7509_011575 [Penicillium cosmopolitanum]